MGDTTDVDVQGVRKVAASADDATGRFIRAHAALIGVLDAHRDCFGDDKNGKEIKKNYDPDAKKAVELAKGLADSGTATIGILRDAPNQFQTIDTDSAGS